MTVEQLVPLIIMAFALGMDAFSVSLGMGMVTLRMRQILYIGMTIGIFHIVMPFIGMVLGRFLSEKFGAYRNFCWSYFINWIRILYCIFFYFRRRRD